MFIQNGSILKVSPQVLNSIGESHTQYAADGHVLLVYIGKTRHVTSKQDSLMVTDFIGRHRSISSIYVKNVYKLEEITDDFSTSTSSVPGINELISDVNRTLPPDMLIDEDTLNSKGKLKNTDRITLVRYHRAYFKLMKFILNVSDTVNEKIDPSSKPKPVYKNKLSGRSIPTYNSNTRLKPTLKYEKEFVIPAGTLDSFLVKDQEEE